MFIAVALSISARPVKSVRVSIRRRFVVKPVLYASLSLHHQSPHLTPHRVSHQPVNTPTQVVAQLTHSQIEWALDDDDHRSPPIGSSRL